MTLPDPQELLDLALAAAATGAQVALSWQQRDLQVEEKAASDDLVSQADRETEDAIREVLLSSRPQDELLGEESGGRSGTSGVRWVVDPIDGTTNYLYGRPDWAVSVAAMSGGLVLAGVVAEPALQRVTSAGSGCGARADGKPLSPLQQDDLSRALVELNLGRPEQKRSAAAVLAALLPRVRDVRRGGSAASALAQVATGRADAAWLPGLQPWDCAAGVLLVQETGGLTGDLQGESREVPASGDVLAAPPGLWPDLLRLLQAAHQD